MASTACLESTRRAIGQDMMLQECTVQAQMIILSSGAFLAGNAGLIRSTNHLTGSLTYSRGPILRCHARQYYSQHNHMTFTYGLPLCKTVADTDRVVQHFRIGK